MDPQWDEVAVFATARVRAVALASGDQETLRNLLHPDFQWTGDDGAQMDRETYVETFTNGETRWRHQHLLDPEVVVVGDTAVGSAPSTTTSTDPMATTSSAAACHRPGSGTETSGAASPPMPGTA